MQTVVYLDILILFNAIITFFILLATSDLLKTDIKRFRLLVGSIMGGLASLLILVPEMNAAAVFFIRILINFFIVAITLQTSDIRFVLKGGCFSLLVTLLFGGIAYFFVLSFDTSKVFVNNGFVYFDVGALGIILIVAISFLMFRLICKYFNNNKLKEIIYNVEIKFSECTVNVSALFDTGNDIYDIYTGKPVILICYSELKHCFDDYTFNSVMGILEGSSQYELPEKFRLLPVRTLGTEKLLPAFSAEEAVVQNKECKKYISKPTIAITKNCLDKNNYSALINKSAIGEYLI